jgi:hypothetical protein
LRCFKPNVEIEAEESLRQISEAGDELRFSLVVALYKGFLKNSKFFPAPIAFFVLGAFFFEKLLNLGTITLEGDINGVGLRGARECFQDGAIVFFELDKRSSCSLPFFGSAQESVRRPDWRGDYESPAPAAVSAFQRNATSGALRPAAACTAGSPG